MPVISKKVCMLGAFAVGKTALVGRFVSSIFEDKYITTVGVNIKKKQIAVGGQDVMLMVWDLAGEDEFQGVQLTHMRGSAGFLLVIDGTRRSTLETALKLQERANKEIGTLPFVVIVNKLDLQPQWEITEADMADLRAKGWTVLQGSAKSGAGVTEAFESLALRAIGAA